MRSNKLFVYGTLKDYGPFKEFLKKGLLVRVGKGRIKAKRIEIMVGRERYPAALEDKGSFVEGDVFFMREPERVLPVLDEYEEFYPERPSESLYIRKMKRARVGDRFFYVHVYLLNRAKLPSEGR